MTSFLRAADRHRQWGTREIQEKVGLSPQTFRVRRKISNVVCVRRRCRRGKGEEIGNGI